MEKIQMLSMRYTLNSFKKRAKALRKREDGATAVEFALVALPFFGLVFAILELAIFFFASRYLEDAVFNMGRKILTQRVNPASACSAVSTEIASMLAGLIQQKYQSHSQRHPALQQLAERSHLVAVPAMGW
jgi:Flp pilus assembly protein TadG